MTYKELLDSVTFDEIVPCIQHLPDTHNCVALYKIHYDMLRHLMPQQGEDDNKFAEIKYEKDDYEGAEPYLDAHPLEGDLWEVSLAKELIVHPEVKESWPEIAARCLWHTSFYGFTDEQIKKTAERLGYYSQNLRDWDIEDIERILAQRLSRRIKALGGYIPTKRDFMIIPSFRAEVRKRMSCFKAKRLRRRIARRRIAREYYSRICTTGGFIVNAAPDKTSRNDITMKELCALFRANHIRTYDYRSYTYNAADRAQWMQDLINKYDAFNHGILRNCVVCLCASSEHPLSTTDRRVADYVLEMCEGHRNLILKTDDSLGEEMRLIVAFYEGGEIIELEETSKEQPL